MAKVLVAYYSRGGNTRAMAEAVAEGARSAGADVGLSPVDKVKVSTLVDYSGIVLGSPVYYGSMAAEVKRFLDESVALHGKLEGKVGGAFASSANLGGGTESTILHILGALLIHGMIVQGSHSGAHYGAVAIGKPDAKSLAECRELGKRVAKLAEALRAGGFPGTSCSR